MLELITKQELAKRAQTIARSYELVQHGSTTYMPAHWKTEEPGPCRPEDRIWLPLSRDDKRRLGNQLGKVLFSNESEVSNFDLMLQQFAFEERAKVSRLLVRTEDGLRELDELGQLSEPTGAFRPNCLRPTLNTNPTDAATVIETFTNWLNSEEEAHSLLRHLSTALSPGWSAVKYLLFIGDGRNGKSVLLSMLVDMFGQGNISNVSRQQMAERQPVCAELNDKLLNVIYDGELTYLKDSSLEKTFVAGEPGYVRLLYGNGNTRVQTNALFMEALNQEPKTRDKSGALQKRLARFNFPNVYPLDPVFENKMRSEAMLGALLSELLAHFVRHDEVALKLKQTKKAEELQVEQQLLNSPLLQFIQYLIQQDAVWIRRFEQGGLKLDPLVGSFMAWRLEEGFSELSTADVQKIIRNGFHSERRSLRENGKVLKQWFLMDPKPETQALLEQLKGEEDGDTDTMVGGA